MRRPVRPQTSIRPGAPDARCVRARSSRRGEHAVSRPAAPRVRDRAGAPPRRESLGQLRPAEGVEQRVRQLEGHADAGERLVRIEALRLTRIDHRAVRQGGAGLVMIRHHHVDAERARAERSRSKGGDAGVPVTIRRIRAGRASTAVTESPYPSIGAVGIRCVTRAPDLPQGGDHHDVEVTPSTS